MLTYGDPYLSLGPFLLEHKNKAGNYIAQVGTKIICQTWKNYSQIHDLMSDAEMDSIKSKTSEKVKATPHLTGGKQMAFEHGYYSSYLSDRTDADLARLTRRLELATGLAIYTPGRRYTADNYRVMKYGPGGKISLHLDAGSSNHQDHLLTIMDDMVGGGRFTTAMLYLSPVEAGGRTIFPKLGLSVPPEPGSLLFWHLRSGW
jgi:prolyl 4-hydroxylase